MIMKVNLLIEKSKMESIITKLMMVFRKRNVVVQNYFNKLVTVEKLLQRHYT